MEVQMYHCSAVVGYIYFQKCGDCRNNDFEGKEDQYQQVILTMFKVTFLDSRTMLANSAGPPVVSLGPSQSICMLVLHVLLLHRIITSDMFGHMRDLDWPINQFDIPGIVFVLACWWHIVWAVTVLLMRWFITLHVEHWLHLHHPRHHHVWNKVTATSKRLLVSLQTDGHNLSG